MDMNTGVETPQTSETIAFSAAFATSPTFRALFDDGIALIEETASYLDADGRLASKVLESDAKLTYATLSMKLTTRLMSIASWLLVQRAVNEGEMTAAKGRDEQRKVKLGSPFEEPEHAERMPIGLIELFSRCADLQHRLMRMQAVLHRDDAPDLSQFRGNGVARDLARLEGAFA